MAPDRRRLLLLVVLTAALALVTYRLWPRPAEPPGAASNSRAAARAAAAPEVAAPDVKLERLELEPPPPDASTNRNLFRFRQAPPPSRPEGPTGQPPAPPPSRPENPGAPGVPPIPLKFIATMSVGGRLMAVLSEGGGRDPVYGFEGDIVQGQYRIVRVGPESIEMTHLDGRGRQTIRFSGS